MVIVSKQIEVPLLEKKLSDYTEGDVVKIPENGAPVEFYVAKHDYESGLNGNGRTLVVRKECYDYRIWKNSSISNRYSSSDIDDWLNNTYINLLDINVKTLIGSTRFNITVDSNGMSSTLTRSIFLLSATELGQSDYLMFNNEGTSLPIANMIKIAYINNIPLNQWTRSPRLNNSNYAIILNTSGNSASGICRSDREGSRPVFTLPSTAKFNPNTNIIIG